MKKIYIRPIMEIVASKHDQDLMAGHSQEWGDAKGNKDWIGEDDEDDVSQNMNLWDD